MAAAAAAAVREAFGPQRSEGLHLVRRQRVRRVVAGDFPDRPARAELSAALRREQNQLGLTQGQYGDHYGVSRSAVARFHSGQGKLTALLRLNLRARHPEWTPLINAVVQEDARRAEAAEARRHPD